MNYEQFYKEVAAWIQACNGQAVKLGMDSNEFWSWVTRSIGELSNKHGNNELVKRQMIMLFNWLKDIYEGSKKVNKNLSRLDREQMTFQIMVNTRYSEKALENMPDDRLLELYRVKVESTRR